MTGAATPGPWCYRSQPLDDWGIVRAGPYIICQARNPKSSAEIEAQARRDGFDPYEANARLIAAAPCLRQEVAASTAEMMGVIQRLRGGGLSDLIGGLARQCDMNRYAIARAEGRLA